MSQLPLVAAPVMTRDEAEALGARVLQLASADTLQLRIVHTSRVITRLANNRVLINDDGDDVTLELTLRYGGRAGVTLSLDQIDPETLAAAVRQTEMLARSRDGSAPRGIEVAPRPRTWRYLPAELWYPSADRGMDELRATVIPAMLDIAVAKGFHTAGFFGTIARAHFVLDRYGTSAYSRETDAECTMTVRTADGTGSGWAGQAHRDWSKIEPLAIAVEATSIAERSARPVALEPGRRTAILAPAAVAQLVRFMGHAFRAQATDRGYTPFSNPGDDPPSKLGQRVFDARVTLASDPCDRDGGYRPFTNGGVPLPRMTWVESGVLTNLAYEGYYALQRGKTFCDPPWSLRMQGGSMSVDAMIAACEDGVYVNRFSGVDLVDSKTGMLTGTTRDGCFLVRNGKLERAVKNFRFQESPFLMLNNVEAIGVTHRAALGYTPPSAYERVTLVPTSWPRPPMIVPALMIRDFHFTALIDAI